MSRSKGAIVETSRLVEKSLSEALKNIMEMRDLLLNLLAFAFRLLQGSETEERKAFSRTDGGV